MQWLRYSNPLRKNQGPITSLPELGERMLSWHGGMGDPIYAVGSYYVSGTEYPDSAVIDDALDSLEGELEQQEAMLRGERIEVRREIPWGSGSEGEAGRHTETDRHLLRARTVVGAR